MDIKTFNVEKNNEVKVDISQLFHTEDLQIWKNIAEEIQKNFTHVFIFGVGGSSLAGQVLNRFTMPHSPVVKFIDILDTEEMEQIKFTPFAKTSFIFIAKSGETIETITQLNYCLHYIDEKKSLPKKHCFILTMKNTPLWKFALQNNIPTIIHPDISGRFSCFTAVAIFPALVAGVNVDEYIEGALEQSNHTIDCVFANVMLRYPIHILMPYIHKLNVFTEWYSQLTAESLSKDEKGYCVVRSIGTKDQHNQLQMFLNGQNNKTYTFIGEGKESDIVICNKVNELKIPNAKLSCLIKSGMYGVIEELSKQGKCVRVIEFDQITPREVGKLFALFMQEVLHQAQQLGVEPFTQPYVLSVKKKMLQFLQSK